jgi:hypothetical protein
MSIIKTSPEFQKSDELAGFLSALFDSNKIKIPIPDPISIIMSQARTGMDSAATSSSVKSRFSEIGIPEGTLDNGQPNVMEGFSDIMCDEIISTMQDEARVDVAINAGYIQTVGSNAAGPVTGVNPAPLGGINALIS